MCTTTTVLLICKHFATYIINNPKFLLQVKYVQLPFHVVKFSTQMSKFLLYKE